MNAFDRIGHFVRQHARKPVLQVDDFYAIHTGTEFEAELRLSDLAEVDRHVHLSGDHASTIAEIVRHYERICKLVETDMTTEQHEAYDALRGGLRDVFKAEARAK